jgi:acyl-CoA reductase-like NAD-dependent aldehyde dehydrogenase
MMTGQVCMSVERVYVEAPVAEAFTQKLVAEMSRLRTGENGAEADIDYGPFTSPRQVEIVERHLDDAKRQGRRASLRRDARRASGRHLLRADGRRRRRPRHGAHDRGDVRPGRSGHAVRDADEALRLANETRYG